MFSVVLSEQQNYICFLFFYLFSIFPRPPTRMCYFNIFKKIIIEKPCPFKKGNYRM